MTDSNSYLPHPSTSENSLHHKDEVQSPLKKFVISESETDSSPTKAVPTKRQRFGIDSDAMLRAVDRSRVRFQIHDRDNIVSILRRVLVHRLDSTVSQGPQQFDDLIGGLVVASLDTRSSQELLWQYGLILVSEKAALSLRRIRSENIDGASMNDVTLQVNGGQIGERTLLKDLLDKEDESVDFGEDVDDAILRALAEEETLNTQNTNKSFGTQRTQPSFIAGSQASEDEAGPEAGDKIYGALLEMATLLSRSPCCKREMLLDCVQFLFRSGRSSLVAHFLSRFSQILRSRQYRDDKRVSGLVKGYSAYADYVRLVREWGRNMADQSSDAVELSTFGCPLSNSDRDLILDKFASAIGSCKGFSDVFLSAYLNLSTATGDGLNEVRDLLTTNARLNSSCLNAQIALYEYLSTLGESDGELFTHAHHVLLSETLARIATLDPANPAISAHSTVTWKVDEDLLDEIVQHLESLTYMHRGRDIEAWRNLDSAIQKLADQNDGMVKVRSIWRDSFRSLWLRTHYGLAGDELNYINVDVRKPAARVLSQAERDMIALKCRILVALEDSSPVACEYAARFN